MVRGFRGGFLVALALIGASCKAANMTTEPIFGEARFSSGRLPAQGFLGVFRFVYATKDDILIPFLPDFAHRRVSALWSVRRRRIVASGLTIGKEADDLPAIGVTDFQIVPQFKLFDFDGYNPPASIGTTRIRLANGTFLEQSGESSLSPCQPLGNYFFLVEDAGGHVLRRKAFLSYDPKPKTVDWNGQRCSETWGEGAVVRAAVHYRMAEYFTVCLIGDNILFVGSEGDYLLTNSELNGPTVDSSLVVIDLNLYNAAVVPDGSFGGALLEATDAALARALGQKMPK